MSYLRYFIILTLAFTLTACAHHAKKRRGQSTHFTAQIAPDESKRFEFTVSPQRRRGNNGNQQPQRPQRGGNNEGQTRGAGIQTQDIYDDVVRLLSTELSQNNYCREGYFELSYTYINEKADRKAIYIGECNEGASEADKKRWKSGEK